MSSYEPTEEDFATYETTNAKYTDGVLTVSLKADEWLQGTLSDIIANSLFTHITTLFAKKITQAVDAQIVKMIEDEARTIINAAMNDFFTRKHKTPGASYLAERSMEDIIKDRVETFMNETVDNRGMVTTGRGRPRYDYLLTTALEVPMQKAINDAVDQVTKAAKARLQENVASYIVEKLMPVVPALPKFTVTDKE